MNPSIKATLLSALVFPGMGQFILKRYYRATVLASVALIALYILVTSAIEKAVAISEKIIAGEIALDINTLSKTISESAAGADASLTNTATITLIIAWLLAIADAWLVGHRHELKRPMPDNKTQS